MMRHIDVTTFVAGNRTGQEVSVEDVEIVECLQGFQEDGLSLTFVPWLADDGGEVFGSRQDLPGLEQISGHCLNVEPVIPPSFLLTQAIVEVIPIDIGDHSFHWAILPKRDSPPARAGVGPGMLSPGGSIM